MSSPNRSQCPISLALEAIGDSWSLLILRDMALRGKKRYGEFLESFEGISTNILADRLAKLEKLGIISKADDPESGKQFIYTPTAKGLDLIPVISALARWGMKHDARANPNPGLKRFIDDERRAMKKIRARFGPAQGAS
jgi:DNA-binding HxlR family transcriptional regulator